ncbi:hypothetical protein HC251_21535 [Iamia sp. SCSIO 61187]|uniref:COG4315 family predicted lipoprotein n=1 Tax=Iamia sp. SCSIO 61187 TaxID=2722752 RepID=UPI001C62FA71|nr:hypothetical protein [Iamia sp. SCSIO 61187]QYG94760.1 hypothetical protein HC251_21535 [Iamia sp. SCSIO 61187]
MAPSRSRIVGAALVAVVLLLAACSDDDEPTATGDGGSATETTASADDAADPYGAASDDGTETTEASDPAAEPTVAVAESDLGPIVVDGQGVTLYLFTNDTQGEPSTCTEGCAATWPALTGPVAAGEGVDEALIGTVANPDGTEQATYDGWPLYYYAQDGGPGDTNGQGVGGVWWVLDAAGEAIEG